MLQILTMIAILIYLFVNLTILVIKLSKENSIIGHPDMTDSILCMCRLRTALSLSVACLTG